MEGKLRQGFSLCPEETVNDSAFFATPVPFRPRYDVFRRGLGRTTDLSAVQDITPRDKNARIGLLRGYVTPNEEHRVKCLRTKIEERGSKRRMEN
jgi:hypothetical protein